MATTVRDDRTSDEARGSGQRSGARWTDHDSVGPEKPHHGRAARTEGASDSRSPRLGHAPEPMS